MLWDILFDDYDANWISIIDEYGYTIELTHDQALNLANRILIMDGEL